MKKITETEKEINPVLNQADNYELEAMTTLYNYKIILSYAPTGNLEPILKKS